MKTMFVVSLILPMFCYAQAKTQRNFEERVVDKNKQISVELDKTANIIDRFLTDGKLTNEKNATTLTLENTIDWYEGGGSPEYKPHIDIKLHLPNLEKKWKLHFTSYDEDSQERGINKNRLKTQAPKENYGASLVLFESVGDIDTTFRPRVEFKDTLITSFILRFKSEIEHSHFSIHPRLEFFARSDTGTGQFAALNFAFPINDTFSISQINEQQYTNVEHKMDVTHGLNLGQILNDLMTLSYAFNLEYSKDPGYHLQRYTLSTSFVHQFYKRVFHYTVMPYLFWDEENKFQGRSGLQLRFEFIF